MSTLMFTPMSNTAKGANYDGTSDSVEHTRIKSFSHSAINVRLHPPVPPQFTKHSAQPTVSPCTTLFYVLFSIPTSAFSLGQLPSSTSTLPLLIRAIMLRSRSASVPLKGERLHQLSAVARQGGGQLGEHPPSWDRPHWLRQLFLPSGGRSWSSVSRVCVEALEYDAWECQTAARGGLLPKRAQHSR